MGFFNNILALFKHKPKEAEKPDSQETCSFCWGYQEYDDKIRYMPKDKQIDVKNHRDKFVKVGKFMVEHVDGFKNKKRVLDRCPKCGKPLNEHSKKYNP